MSHAEFIEWAAFASIEPLPEARADLRNALHMLLTANIHKGKKGKKLKLEAFLPDFWNDRRNPRRLAAKFMALTGGLSEGESAPADSAAGLTTNLIEEGSQRRG